MSCDTKCEFTKKIESGDKKKVSVEKPKEKSCDITGKNADKCTGKMDTQLLVMDGCPNCEALSKDMLKQEIEKRLNIEKIDIYSDKGKKIAKKHDITGAPTMLINGGVCDLAKEGDRLVAICKDKTVYL